MLVGLCQAFEELQRFGFIGQAFQQVCGEFYDCFIYFQPDFQPISLYLTDRLSHHCIEGHDKIAFAHWQQGHLLYRMII